MAEIKFTAARMQAVHERLGELINQLQRGVTGSVDALNSLSNIIQSSEVGSGIAEYKTALDNEMDAMVKNLTSLDEYLVKKLNEYNALNAASAESIASVQSILNEIEGM